AKDVSRAGVRAYDEKHLSSIETLNRALISALQKIRNVQKEIITKKQNSSRLDQLRSLAALKGKTMDRFMDVELWGRAHALSSVFQIWHGMVWFNLRFFFNPVTDRLEPILYDNMAHSPSVRDPVIFIPDPLVLSLAESGQYTLSFHRNLARFCETPFFEELFRKIGPDLIRYQSALDQESKLPVEFRFDTIKQRLRTQQIYLKEMIHPLDAVNFDCAFLLQEGSTSTVSATCEVKAWSTTRMPPLLLGFNFSNGHFISARSCWSGPESMQPVLDGQGVMLPPDGEPLLFRFPADWRLTNLRNLKEFKDAIRQNQPNRGKGASIRISALYRMAAGGEVREEPLVFHACEEAWTLEEGRPCSPSLAEALDRYPCLEYQMDTDELHVRGGTWTLKEDLLVPAGYALHIPEGVTLRFAAEAALVTDSPLFFKGTAERPVVLEPEEGLESWSGILVLNAKERSLWEHAVIRKTNNIMRAGWITTGGITFYHSPVTLIDTSIEATLAEDGLNLFGTDFLMERVVFSGCASDSFDGDFVTGTVRDCLFRDGRADGVDFSGSHVTVENCVFTDLLDKGLSIGENTKCKVIGCSIQRTLIGLASKDSSTVSVQGLSLEGIRNFSIAVYVKKPEYGPSRVEAGGLSFAEGPRAPFLVQTGCELLVDGNLVPTEEVDVERLYEEKLLGN
ncbi:MAG: right-handed parallel beta-helix repeat-containing protein, partial [Planctomycetota bacterium]